MPSNSEAPKRTPAVQAFIRRFAAFQQRDEDEVVDPQALYRLEEDQLLLRVFEAKRLTKIGGGQIESDYNRVLKLEKAKRWAEALTQLRVVGLNAQRVLLQQPWLEARRAHMADIEAGKKITRPESGPTWGARITELAVAAQDLADRQRFGAAAQKLIAASDLAKAAAQDPDLAHSRTSLAQQRETNVVAMNSIVGSGGELSPAQIDQLKICARWEFETLSKQAQNLGVDPSAPSREPIQDKKKCKQLFKDHDWFELKRMFHSNQVSKEDMWDLWRYRQDFVTRAFDTLRRTFPTLITKASGSVNLESDIDVTFASPGSGDDVKAAMAFNKHVIKVFGKPPGRTFDVNIYPRDYNPIKESFNTDYNLDPIVDRGIDEPTDDMHRLSRIDQDVATLLKQRRFLDGPTFKNLLDSILAAAPEDKRPKIRQRFEEGESIYLLTSLEKVDAIVHDLKKKKVPRSEYGDDLPSWLSRLQHLRKNKQKGSLESIKEMQNLLPAVLDLLEQTFEAHVMETTDRLYLERMADIREEQGRIRALSNEDADVDEHHPGQSCHEAHSGEEHADWRVAEDERTRAQVKKRQFETILFANEAYMSQGAIEHIVAGGQAKKADPARAQQVLDGLTPSTLMQSCNEQLADFFKDMKAYEAHVSSMGDDHAKRRETGEAFVHASKYLVRLLDGAQILFDRYKKRGSPLTFTLLSQAAKRPAGSGVVEPKDLKEKVADLLYALRGSSTVPASVKGELGLAEVEALFGVSTISGLQTTMSDFAIELNAKVRSSPAFQNEQEVQPETEARFHGVPDQPAELSILLARAEGIRDDALPYTDPDSDHPLSNSELQRVHDDVDDMLDELREFHQGEGRYLHDAHRNEVQGFLRELGAIKGKLRRAIR